MLNELNCFSPALVSQEVFVCQITAQQMKIKFRFYEIKLTLRATPESQTAEDQKSSVVVVSESWKRCRLMRWSFSDVQLSEANLCEKLWEKSFNQQFIINIHIIKSIHMTWSCEEAEIRPEIQEAGAATSDDNRWKTPASGLGIILNASGRI